MDRAEDFHALSSTDAFPKKKKKRCTTAPSDLLLFGKVMDHVLFLLSEA